MFLFNFWVWKNPHIPHFKNWVWKWNIYIILYYIVWLNVENAAFLIYTVKEIQSLFHYCTLGCKHTHTINVWVLKKCSSLVDIPKIFVICIYIYKYFKPVSTIEWSITSSTIVQRSILYILHIWLLTFCLVPYATHVSQNIYTYLSVQHTTEENNFITL